MNHRNLVIAAIVITASAGLGVHSGRAVTSTGTVVTAQGQPGTIDFSADYTIQVKVWDSADQESAWSALFPYSTKPGPWPQASISYTPAMPAAQQDIQFFDATPPQYSVTGWLWQFSDGATSTEQNPVHQFAAEGAFSATLHATNTGGTCSVTANLGIQKPIPTYREVLPGQPSTTR